MYPVTNDNQGAGGILRFCPRSIPVDPALAKVFGINCAVVIQQLHHLLRISNGKPGHIFEGYTWVWNTYEQWTEQFPWLSAGTVRNIFNKLVDYGIVLREEKNPHQWKRILYYRIDYNQLAEVMRSHSYEQLPSSGANCSQPEMTKFCTSSNNSCRNDNKQLITSITGTETTTEASIKTYSDKEMVVS